MRKGLSPALAAAVSICCSRPAVGAQIQFDEKGMPGIVVAYGDLDLRRYDDQRLLKQRVVSAVHDLCGRYGERTISIITDIQRCRKRTMASAQEVMNTVIASGTWSSQGRDGAKLAFAPCHVGRGRILWCDVRSVLSSGTVKSRASEAIVTTLSPGFTALGEVGHVYRPSTLPAGPRPFILLLHGAGGDARQFLEMLKPVADERGYIMAAAKSLAATWDIPANMATGSGVGVGVANDVPNFGPDVPRIDAMLREIFARVTIDPKQVVLVGFSDGASYALSLSLANSDVFPSVVALSPGFVKLPAKFEAGQRVFIAHGTRDEVIPFPAAKRIAEVLRSKQLSVRFRPFEGVHAVSRAVLLEGLDFALPRRSEQALMGGGRTS